MFSVRFLVALAIHGRVFAVDVSHPDASPGHMEATILAEGESQIRSVVRKENVSAENDEGKSCKCTEVDLKGKKWSPGGLQKCVGSCTDVRKSTSQNDCPKHWKIISPRNEEDWKTLIDLDVLKEVAAPHLERRSAIDLHGTSAALHAASASHRASPTDTRFAASTSAGGEPRQLPDCAIDIGTGDFLEDKMPFPTSPTPAPTPTPIYDSPPPPSQTKGQGQGRSTDLLNLMFDGPGGDRRLNAPAKQQARQGEGRGAAETVTLDTDAVGKAKGSVWTLTLDQAHKILVGMDASDEFRERREGTMEDHHQAISKAAAHISEPRKGEKFPESSALKALRREALYKQAPEKTAADFGKQYASSTRGSTNCGFETQVTHWGTDATAEGGNEVSELRKKFIQQMCFSSSKGGRKTTPSDRDHRVPSTCSYFFSLGGSTRRGEHGLVPPPQEEHWGGSVRWLDSGDEHSKPPQHPPQEKPAASSTGGRRLGDSSIYDLTNYTKGRPIPEPPCLRDPAEDCLKAAQQRHGPKTAQLHQPKLVDVTQPKNGPGGDRSHPMNSGEKGRSMWVTIDGSEWWLRDKVFHEPSGDYHANCFLHIFRFANPSDIQFN
ncbi:unnamed protein product, partial [Symbiodinium microadriaticum]